MAFLPPAAVTGICVTGGRDKSGNHGTGSQRLANAGKSPTRPAVVQPMQSIAKADRVQGVPHLLDRR